MLAFPALLLAPDTLHLVITAYNNIPLMGDLLVHELPPPVVAGFTGVPTTVVPGHTVAFADTSFGQTTTWEWHFPGGTPSVSYEKYPIVTYDTLGTWDVQLIAGDGFTTDSVLTTGYIVVDFPATAGELAKPLTCTVTPNPGNGRFTLDIRSVKADMLDLKVFDMVGHAVYSEKNIPVTDKLHKTLDLTALQKGIYFLNISGQTGMFTLKLIIAR
jgi:hypothetical protein